MPESPEVPEWNNIGGGTLERGSTGKFGQKIVERRNPGRRTGSKWEYFDDAQRHFDEGSETLPFPKYTEISFINPQAQALISLTLRGDAYLPVLFIRNTRPIEFLPPPDRDSALIKIRYRGNEIESCVLQAEEPSEPGLSPADIEYYEGRGWEETLETAVNYIRTADEGDLWSIRDRFSTGIEKLRDEPLFKTAESRAKEACDRILNSVPPDDREEYAGLLGKAAFQDQLLEAFFLEGEESDLTEDDLSQMDLNPYINKVTLELIKDLAMMTSKFAVSQQLLEVNFKDDGISWQEIEREEKWTDVTPKEALVEGKPFIEEKREIVGRNFTPYGNDISVQDNLFTIDRQGHIITVTCKSSTQKPKWTGKFLLRIPFGEIQSLGQDRQSDFRQIRQLLGADLRVA